MRKGTSDVNMIKRIEEKLSQLMNMIDEKEYTNFIENNKLMKIYDLVMELEESENVLSDETLDKILNLIETKIKSNH